MARRELAGARALTPPRAQAPLKTYVLWGVLVAGALLVATLAIRLLRKVN